MRRTKGRIWYRLGLGHEREEGTRQDVQVSHKLVKNDKRDFLGGSEVKNLPASTGDTGWILGQEYTTCYGAIKPMHHND